MILVRLGKLHRIFCTTTFKTIGLLPKPTEILKVSDK